MSRPPVRSQPSGAADCGDLEKSDGLARVAVALGNGCSHAYVIAGTANDLRVAAARIARAVEASETMSVRGSSVGE